MVKRKRLKYSKIKFNAYLSLNELAQKFLKDTGCSATEWGYLLRGTEYLEFIVTKNIREDFITVQIRYRGHLLGTFQQQDKSTLGYRFTKGGSNSFKDLPKSLYVSKLNKAIAELLNYSLIDNIAQFRVVVDSKRLSYIKYNFRNKRVEVGGTDLYIVGTERNTKIPQIRKFVLFHSATGKYLSRVRYIRKGGWYDIKFTKNLSKVKVWNSQALAESQAQRIFARHKNISLEVKEIK